jgi:hypothetical protein
MEKYSHSFLCSKCDRLWKNRWELKKKCLIYDGFRVDRILKNNDISWRCTNNKSKCKARVRTDGESKVVMSAMSKFPGCMFRRPDGVRAVIQLEGVCLRPPRDGRGRYCSTIGTTFSLQPPEDHEFEILGSHLSVLQVLVVIVFKGLRALN